MKLTNQLIAPALLVLALAISSSSCRKSKDAEAKAATETSEVLNDFSYKVVLATYLDLEAKANALHLKVIQFNSSNTSSDLEASKLLWKDTRAVWELNEAFLFGPVATENFDPEIDDWPVNKGDLDSLLISNQTFTQGFLDSTQTMGNNDSSAILHQLPQGFLDVLLTMAVQSACSLI